MKDPLLLLFQAEQELQTAKRQGASPDYVAALELARANLRARLRNGGAPFMSREDLQRSAAGVRGGHQTKRSRDLDARRALQQMAEERRQRRRTG